MKRFLIMIMALFALVALSACGKKEYPYDGEFTAFKYADEVDASDLTWVTVTVEKGKVVSYYIDVLQYKNGEFLEKSKKELGYEYGMKETSANRGVIEGGAEWFEQAAVIEAAFLKDGPAKLSLDKDDHIDGLTGATITGKTYKEVALAALDLAQDGNHIDLPDQIKNRLEK